SWMGCCASPTARSVSFNSDGSVGTEGAFGGFAGVRPNTFDHRGEAVGALRREVLLEPELGQDPAGIDCENLLGRLVLVDREQDGDQPAHDMRIAVALKTQPRLPRPVGRRHDLGYQPDLAGAAT